jgi:hypothetical protein
MKCSTTPTSVSFFAMPYPQDVDLVSLDVVPYPVRTYPPAVLSGLGDDDFAPLIWILPDLPKGFQDPLLILRVYVSEILVETVGDDQLIPVRH